MARHEIVTCDIAPWLSLRMPNKLDAIQVIRRANPKCRILAYHLVTHWYWGPTTIISPTLPSFQYDWHSTIQATSGWETGTIVPGYEVDWAKRVTADALTELLCRVARARVFDGVFLDYLSPVNDVAAEVNMRRAVKRIREAGGPGFVVLGNGINAERLGVDGIFREGFPNHLPNSSFDKVRVAFEDYPASDNWLQAGVDSTQNTEVQAARFAHGTACLFGAACSFGPGRNTGAQPPYQGWWFDFYAVDPQGNASTLAEHTGWLGEPWERPAQVLTHMPLWVRAFAGGLVLVNPGTSSINCPVPKGLFSISTGVEMGSVTVAAKDAAFLWRSR